MTISTSIIRHAMVVAAFALAAAVLAPVGQAWREDGPDGRVERPALQTVNSGLVSKSLIEAHYAHEARDAELASGARSVQGGSTHALITADGPEGGFDFDDALVGAGLGFGSALAAVATAVLLRRHRLHPAGF
jgi:hypothetical protein